MGTARELFGTDGIRGIANKYPMTAEVALQFGKAVALSFRNGKLPTIVLGKDTRLSGYLFENALTAGLLSAGANVLLVGPMPTPAIAHLTKSFAADAGIVITASHNPAEHNGIKLFDSQGFKLPDSQEREIERIILENMTKEGSYQDSDEPIGKARRIDDAKGRYIEFAKATVQNRSLKGLKIVLDCANGASYIVSPTIFKELGADVIALHVEPDGLNINKECGALHPEKLAAAVLEHHADVGIALDGDADRLLMVDERGKEVDGDHLLAILALDLQQQGRLAKQTVVGTTYTNKGFEEAMRGAGIGLIRVENGDRYIIEELRTHGYNLGGEQSGHIVLFDYCPTGDGTIAALQILRIMRESGKRLSELATCMTRWPQVVKNGPVKEKRPIESLAKVTAAIKNAKTVLGENGRLFIRYSGTEQKVRVMVEAKDDSMIEKLAERILHAFKEEGL